MEASKPKNAIPAEQCAKSKFLATSIHESTFWRVCSGVAVDVSDCSPSQNRSVASIVTNAEIASIFDHVADLLEYQGSNVFRVRAYRNAARLVQGIVEPLTSIRDASNRSFLELDGIGKDLAQKLETLLDSGHLPMLKQLEEEVPKVVFDLMRVPGLGPKKVKLLMAALELESLKDLEIACQEGRVSLLKGFGKKTEQSILSNIAFAQNPDNSRLLWDEADQIVSLLIQWMKECASVQRIEAAGSWRRGKETVGDIDLLVESRQAKEVMDHFLAWEHTDHAIVRGDSKTSIRGPHGIQVDMRVVQKKSFGAAWQYFTGSKEHNVRLRSRAKKLGLSINEYGVTELNKIDGKILAGKSEKDVYESVGLEWIPPEMREDRGELELSENGDLPKLITLTDICGDLHMHTTATDGEATLTEMAAAAVDRGLMYIAITDHSKRVTMARGLDAKRLHKQWEEIDCLNESLARDGSPSLVVLKGIEVDILEKGGLDLPEDVLAHADWVVASLHYGQQQSEEQITGRILDAICHPYVNCIGHPTGRLINRRPAYKVDLQRVIDAAAEHTTCLEINANPWRLDLDDRLSAAAKEAGVKLAISTDAHTTTGLDVMRCGILQARRAGLEAGDVVNTLSLPSLKETLKKRNKTP
jgi:DNA polymerase (family 10)